MSRRATGARMVLFSESNNEGRFSKWLGKTCLGREEKIREMGICITMIGTHSFRKGIAIYLSSHPDGPSPVNIFLRAGWSLGNVQSRYIFAGSGGDQFVGRTACGLPLSDWTFSLLPPYFERSTGPLMSNDEWENILPGYRNFPSPFLSVLPFLVASLSHHSDWIKDKFDPKHPIFHTRLWTSGLLDQLRLNILTGCTSNEESGMTASGIPATVAMANRVYEVESQLRDIQNVLKENQTALIQDLPGVITERILENCQINGAIPVSKQDILALIAEVRNQNNNLNAAIPSTMSASPDSVLTYSRWSWAKNSDDIYRSHPVPIDFEFPK